MLRRALRALSSDASVYAARQRIFGAAIPGDPVPFKSLRTIKARGFIGPKVVAYHPEPVKLSRHPLLRQVFNEQRLERIQINRKLGKAPPKKGAGKRKSKKK